MSLVVPATWMVSGEKGPTENLTASVLLAFSVRVVSTEGLYAIAVYTCNTLTTQ